MSVRTVMHYADPSKPGKTACGVRLTGENAVPPRYAQYVTCQRCLASLRASALA